MTDEQTTAGYDWMDRHEVAALLNRNVWTIDRWSRAGKGPPFHKLHGKKQYKRADVDAWIEAHRVEGGPV